MSEPLDYSVTEFTIVLRGEIDMLHAAELIDLIATRIEEGATVLRFDVSGVTFMDSTGIGALAYAGRFATVEILGASGRIAELLRFVDLIDPPPPSP